jgi:putative lipoprotein
MMRHLFPILALAPLAACATAPPVGDGVRVVAVDGTVTYRERIALPPDAIVVIQLLEVNQAGAPQEALAEQRIVTAGRQVPIPFSFGYDRARIEPGGAYTVAARIESADGTLLWVSDTRAPMPAVGSKVTLNLVRADGRR